MYAIWITCAGSTKHRYATVYGVCVLVLCMFTFMCYRKGIANLVWKHCIHIWRTQRMLRMYALTSILKSDVNGLFRSSYVMYLALFDAGISTGSCRKIIYS